ncbi:unnamed protein product [Nesidiocoris tenuis]|uniref:Uncharacterized protein n=1 Tax=Nesidiocoris tenuis TaxID=355587 RepID=A0A6H5HM77_9HEMI|nr:unnamed protein product [Nesidiocoris tenuis]
MYSKLTTFTQNYSRNMYLTSLKPLFSYATEKRHPSCSSTSICILTENKPCKLKYISIRPVRTSQSWAVPD